MSPALCIDKGGIQRWGGRDEGLAEGECTIQFRDEIGEVERSRVSDQFRRIGPVKGERPEINETDFIIEKWPLSDSRSIFCFSWPEENLSVSIMV